MKDIQNILLQSITQFLPASRPLEVALLEVLKLPDLATASALVKGQQALSLNDAATLANHFGLSLAHLTDATPSVIPFRFRAIGYNLSSLADYFNAILEELQRADVLGPRRLIYAANDFPLFSLFQFPELAAFKLYFWGRTVYDLPAFAKRQFKLADIDTANIRLGEQTWRQYLKMPSIEIWSSDIVNNTLKQIYHAWRFGLFANKEDAKIVLEQVGALLQHTELQAEQGRKFHPKNYPPKHPNYQLFYNEVAISTNTILFSSETSNVAFVVQNTLNYLVTDHPTFCLQTEGWLKNLLRRSTPISEQNHELRQLFFKELHKNIIFIRDEILNS